MAGEVPPLRAKITSFLVKHTKRCRDPSGRASCSRCCSTQRRVSRHPVDPSTDSLPHVEGFGAASGFCWGTSVWAEPAASPGTSQLQTGKFQYSSPAAFPLPWLHHARAHLHSDQPENTLRLPSLLLATGTATPAHEIIDNSSPDR